MTMPRKPKLGQSEGIKRVLISKDITEETEEMIRAREERRTQGRKGMKAARVNTSFTPSNIEYLRKIAGLEGMSMTEYLNELVKRDMERRGEALKQAWAILDATKLNPGKTKEDIEQAWNIIKDSRPKDDKEDK